MTIATSPPPIAVDQRFALSLRDVDARVFVPAVVAVHRLHRRRRVEQDHDAARLAVDRAERRIERGEQHERRG